MKKSFRLIIGLLVLTVIVFVVYNINQLEKEISEKHYSDLVYDLSSVTNNFGVWISNKKDILDTTKDIVDNFDYNEIVMWKTENPYLNINNEDPDISQVYIGLSNGGFITGGQWVPPDDYDPRSRIWYHEAVETDSTIVSRVYTDKETGDQIVTISTPLSIQGSFVGVISADVFLNNIHEYLEKQISEDNIYTYLVDHDGTIIIHTDRESLVGKNLYTDIQDEVLINYFEEVKTGSETVRMEYVFGEQNIRGIIQKVEGGDWYLAVALNYDNRLFNSGFLNKGNLIINGLGLLIMLVLIYMIIKMKTELDNMNKSLTDDNEKDFLTGIYNRRYFNLHLENIWMLENEASEVSLMIMDIDNFKEYNDTYGHVQGDEVLKEVTKCISNHVRKGDVFARYGGEEFSLILLGVPIDIAEKVGNTIKESIYERNIVHETSQYKRITISIGMTTVTLSSGISVRDTIDHADSALYEAKAKGRNAVVLYQSGS